MPDAAATLGKPAESSNGLPEVDRPAIEAMDFRSPLSREGPTGTVLTMTLVGWRLPNSRLKKDAEQVLLLPNSPERLFLACRFGVIDGRHAFWIRLHAEESPCAFSRLPVRAG
jgi:hypothetical protein